MKKRSIFATYGSASSWHADGSPANAIQRPCHDSWTLHVAQGNTNGRSRAPPHDVADLIVTCVVAHCSQSLTRGMRWFRRGNPRVRWGWQLLFDRLKNNALGHLVYLDAELLYLDAELLYAASKIGESKGHGLKLLDQFNGSYKFGGR